MEIGMTKYKAGDLVTFKLSAHGALDFNRSENFGISFYSGDVIKHEPAPEPVTHIVYLHKNDIYTNGQAIPFRGNVMDVLTTKIKLTYCPTTRAVKAEVV